MEFKQLLVASSNKKIVDGEKKLPLRLCYEMGFSKEILDLVSNANPNAQEFMFGKMRDKFPTGNPMNNNQDLL